MMMTAARWPCTIGRWTTADGARTVQNPWLPNQNQFSSFLFPICVITHSTKGEHSPLTLTCLFCFFSLCFHIRHDSQKQKLKRTFFFFFLNKKYVGRDEKEKEYSNALLRIHDECAVWGPTERAQPRPMKWPIKLSHIYYNIHTFLLNVGTGTHSTLGAAFINLTFSLYTLYTHTHNI